MQETLTFSDLGISADILESLTRKGFTTPTPIQAKTIPLLLSTQQDVIGQAQTGSGKTAAFSIPILEKVKPGMRKVQALVLTPTRELAVQVTEEIVSFKGKRNVYILPVYGGQGMEYQLKRLRDGVDIVVGTPGRVIDHIKRGTLDLSLTQFVVLDEADEMLNMGFAEDIEEILQHVSEQRQMLLFSATMPDRILQIARSYMKDYTIVSIPKLAANTPQIEQRYYEVFTEDKLNALCRIIDASKEFYALVFCKTKTGTDELAHQLIEKGYGVEALHGDVSQNQRESIMRKFKLKRATILVATDVAARGLDVNDLTHVINFDLPQDPETYVHRIGRTGRAGKKGLAITLISPSEFSKFQFIQRISKVQVEKAKIPTVKEIIDIKKAHIFEQLTEWIAEENHLDFMDAAEQLLSFDEPTDLVAALLKKIYGSQLQEDAYPEIRDPRPRRDKPSFDNERPKMLRPGQRPDNNRFNDRFDSPRREVNRGAGGLYGGGSSGGGGKSESLYFAKGSKEGVTSLKLLSYLEKEANVPRHKVTGIEIFGQYSTFMVPASESEKILNKFATGKDKKPLIRRDKGRNETRR